MSPLLSIAADGIQRLSASAGANVPWSCMCQSPAPIFSMLYQRAPARSLPTSTEWLVTSVCQPPKLRYCARHIPRSDSVWSLTVVPGCGMHAPKSQRFSSYGGRLDVGVVRDRDRRSPAPVDGGVRDLDLIVREARPVLVDRDERGGRAVGRRRVAVGVGRDSVAGKYGSIASMSWYTKRAVWQFSIASRSKAQMPTPAKPAPSRNWFAVIVYECWLGQTPIFG